GLGVVQYILKLHLARPRTDRYHGRTDQSATEGNYDPLGTIAHQERDRLPRADAQLPEATGHRRRLRIQPGVGQPPRRQYDGFLLGYGLSQVRQEGPDRSPLWKHL